MIAGSEIRKAIVRTLAQAPAITAIVGDRIYHLDAPANAAYPFVVIFKQPGARPAHTFVNTAWDDTSWLVKCIDKSGSSTKAEAVQAAVDAVLDDAALTIDGGTLFYLRRESDVDYPEHDGNGVTYRHHGGVYRLVVG